MDEIQQKIEDFQKQLLPPQSILKQTLLSCPAVLPAVGLIGGLALQYYFPIPLSVWIVILIFSAALFLLQKFLSKIYLVFISVLMCFICLGGIRLINFHTPAANDIRNIKFEDFIFTHIKAQIISEPRVIVADESDWLFSKFSQSYPYTTFYAKVTEIKTDAGWKKTKGTIKFYMAEDANYLNAGDAFQSFCWLEKFSPTDNPGQFDTAKYMNRNGVFLSASVKSTNAITVFSCEKSKTPFDIKAKFRQLAIAALNDNTEQNDSTRLVEALLLGSRTKIDRQLYNDFIKTGLVHLVALSGLNVGIMAGCFWWFAKKAGLLHRGRAIVSIIATIIFILAVPAASSTIRAGIMFTIFCLGPLLDRQSKALNSLALSAIFLLLIRPTDFLDAGFQLSFAAVLGILFFYEPIRNFFILPAEPLRETPFYPLLRTPLDMFAVSLAAWSAVIPIITWHFYQFQLFTALWTVPASLPATVIIIFGTLKILLNPLLPTLATGCAIVVDFSAKVLSELVTILAKVPFSNIAFGKFPIYAVLLCYLLIFLWKFFPFRRKTILNFAYPAALLFLFIAGFSINRFKNSNNLQLAVLSVGHGQAAFIKTPDNKNFIIDAGSMSKSNIGDTIVNPFLNYIAAGKIDSVFISHDDIDHYNGLPEILDKHNCKKVYTTPQFIQSAATSTTDAKLSEFIRSKNIPLGVAPEKISLGKITITRLWPKETLAGSVSSDNESALVLLFEYAGRKILFCSDITKDVQNQFVNLYPALDVDIMVTPHHGSGRTLEPLFLNAFKPEFLITSCVEARLGSISREIIDFGQSYYTCRDGALTATINSKGKIRFETFR